MKESITDSVSRLFILNKFFIKRDAEREYEQLLDRADGISGKFGRKFYLHIFNTVKADAVDLYFDLCGSAKGKIKNAREIRPAIKDIMKWMSVHHLLCFSSIEEDEKINGLNELVFSIFGWSDCEKERLYRLHELSLSSLSMFEVEFSSLIISYFVKDSMSNQQISPITLAFVNNFFYNSYKGFISTLTNYASLSTLMNEKSKGRSAARN